MKTLTFVLWAGLTASIASAADLTSCTSTREFITTLEYLRQAKIMAVPEADARKTATQVASHCTGAASRFIRVTEVLSQTGLNGTDAIRLGGVFSGRSDQETETFLAVFKRAYLEDELDLDISASIRMAMSLSVEFAGDVLAVRDDFETILDYCLSTKHLDLPRPQCASFAAELARKGQAWSGGVSRDFVATFEFLRSPEGPSLITGRALKFSEELIAAGPDSPQNFVQAYKYATSKKGLDLSREDAMGFAKKLAMNSSPVDITPATPSAPFKPGVKPGAKPSEKNSAPTMSPNRKLGSVPESR